MSDLNIVTDRLLCIRYPINCLVDLEETLEQSAHIVLKRIESFVAQIFNFSLLVPFMLAKLILVIHCLSYAA